MQLLAIILYGRNGERRILRLQPGALNVITGISATGKSALLQIVEFCLGRDTVVIPVGPITNAVSWYALLIELPTTRVFIARPAPASGRASMSQAMLEIGANLEPLELGDLMVNSDSGAVREQLGRMVGIGENTTSPPPRSSRSSFEAHLGHAVLLCLQEQGEIANRRFLFHRQGEQGMALAIQDTLPYFLGAVPADQARLRQDLRSARRELRRLETELVSTENLNTEIDAELRALHDEAYVQGLVAARNTDDRSAVLEDLRAALNLAVRQVPDDEQADRRRELESQRADLRRRLRTVTDQRALLLEEKVGEQSYEGVVTTAVARLRVINVIPLRDGTTSGSTCPICGSHLEEPDATVAEIRQAATDLQAQLTSVEASRPRREAELARLSSEADQIRQELRGIEGALAGLAGSDQRVILAERLLEQQAFTKGRIDHYLGRLALTDEGSVDRLRNLIRAAQARVEGLEQQLDPEEAREQLMSRLVILSEDMTRWANELQLEHAGQPVRLDIRHLTVVTDTDTGPAQLFRVGSAENWVGAHIITHLALHRYFVRRRRPVPRFLMLDQPTQAYYPSDVQQREAGEFTEDADRRAVLRLFELIRDVVGDLAPNFQVIVCDHANLREDWFQNSVRQNWREGRKLVPQDWIQ